MISARFKFTDQTMRPMELAKSYIRSANSLIQDSCLGTVSMMDAHESAQERGKR
jgi:hypothetical protein